MAKVKKDYFTKNRGDVMHQKKQSKQGYILLEGLVLLGILGILLTLLLPTYVQGIQKAEESVCKRNCWNLEKLYEVDLVIHNKTHSKEAFHTFLMGQSGVCCPEGGSIKYEAGSVICTRHEIVAEMAHLKETAQVTSTRS